MGPPCRPLLPRLFPSPSLYNHLAPSLSPPKALIMAGKPRRLHSILPHHNNPDQDHLPVPQLPPKKKSFTAAALRGLGCSTSSSKVFAPSSGPSDGPTNGSAGRRRKMREKKREGEIPVMPLQSAPVTGVGITEKDEAADPEGLERAILESDRDFAVRQSGTRRWSRVETPVFGSEPDLPRHLRRSWRVCSSPSGLLEELMLFDAGLLLAELDVFDRHRDLRIDVDNMAYEELLELEDSIGYVNTGLSEDEINRCIRNSKHSIFGSSFQFSAETDHMCRCSICLDEYRVGDDVGMLKCGHGYHSHCIRQWLLMKNSCPVCKAAAGRG